MDNSLSGLKCLVIGADKDAGFHSTIALLKRGAGTIYIQGFSKMTAVTTATKLNELAKKCDWSGTVSVCEQASMFEVLDPQNPLLKDVSVLVVNTTAPLEYFNYFTFRGSPEEKLLKKLEQFKENINTFLKGSLQEHASSLRIIFLGLSKRIHWCETSEIKDFLIFEKSEKQFLVNQFMRDPKISVNIIKHGYLVSSNGSIDFINLPVEDIESIIPENLYRCRVLEDVICTLSSAAGSAVKGSTIHLGTI